MRRRPRRVLLVATAAAVAGALAPASAAGTGAPALVPTPAVVEQPRPFGAVVGDVLTQRVLLAASGRDFEPAALPAPSRLGAWFERRAARVAESPDGRRWLEVDYQLVNAPPSQATVRLPAWDLAGRAPGTALHVAAWPIVVTAMTPKAAPGTAAWQLRPDRPPPPLPLDALRRRLLLSSSALAACVAAWIAWFGWRQWRAAATQPFAAALRELRRLGDAHPAAWRTLHAAFDRTAGETLRETTLPRLFQRAPHLAPLEAPIRRFYALSAARFFADATRDDATPPTPLTPLTPLCRDLRRLERRNER